LKKAYLWLYNDNFITLELQWLTQTFHQTKRRNSIRCWISSRMWGWYTLDVSSLAPSYWKMVTTVMFYEKSEVFIVSKANVNNSKKNHVFVKIAIVFWYLWTKNPFQYFHYQWFKTLSNKILGIHTTLNIIQNVRTVYVRDVSGLAPSFCKMVPLILFNKKVSNLWQVQIQEKLQIFLRMTFYRNSISQNENLAQFYHWKIILFTKWKLDQIGSERI